VTTPEDVVIENNYFRTAGTAILLEGDTDHWFESGANTNVRIHNNVFEDCLTSGNKNGSRWEWGDAVITITPSHRPSDEKTEPYHRHVVIRNNVFKVFDAPLVRARSVRGLQFIENTVIKTDVCTPYTWQKSAFLLDGCRETLIRDNRIDDRYTTRDILIEHMRKSDVKADRIFRIDFVRGINTYLN
jgi:polygalacturonase